MDGKTVGAQNILVHPNGRVLYCTLRGLDLIVVAYHTQIEWHHICTIIAELYEEYHDKPIDGTEWSESSPPA